MTSNYYDHSRHSSTSTTPNKIVNVREAILADEQSIDLSNDFGKISPATKQNIT